MRAQFILRAPLLALTTFATLAAVASGCNDVPVATQCEGFTLQVAETQTSRDPVKLDFLWIVDDSTSMCQEQASLAESINVFVTQLQEYLNVDIRTAVVTTSALITAKRGKFNRTPATEFPPLCQEERLFPARSDLFCECAACAGWDEAYAYQCGQDAECPGDPTQVAPDYQACIAAQGCRQENVGGDLTEEERARRAELADLWQWEAPVGGISNIYNLNGSVNSTCQLKCGAGQPTVADAREIGTQICRDWFGSDSMVCQVPDLTNTGCIKPPATAACPEDLPAVLPAYNADGSIKYGLEYFPCIATVGADQNTDANLEQGMKSAWLALDETGPHPLQICDPNWLEDPANSAFTDAEKRERCDRVFLRRNAFLIIIFVTDEDDCSVAEDKEIKKEDHNQCALLGDIDTAPLTTPRAGTTDIQPLAPVFQYANRLRSLKQNPANVFVAAIVGDAWNPVRELSAAEVDAARSLYYESKVERGNQLALNTAICASAFGRADLGLRYIRLTQQFGPHGFHANICSNEGVGPALQEIAAELVSEVVSICLPRPVKKSEDDQELVSVHKTGTDEGAERQTLTQGVDFRVDDQLEEGACPGSGRAIYFDKGALPLPEDKIEIIYEAEADCGF